MTQLDQIQFMLGILIVVECLKWYRSIVARNHFRETMLMFPLSRHVAQEEPDPADWWRQPRDEGDHP